jgi:hypothetical protein
VPWFDVDEMARRKGDKAVKLRAIIGEMRSFHNNRFSVGLCSNFDEAICALRSANQTEEICEIVYVDISSPKVTDVAVTFPELTGECIATEFYGRDPFIDGYGSLLAMSVYLYPQEFQDFTRDLNRRGLFDDHNLATVEFPSAYVQRERQLNMEPIAGVIDRVVDVRIFGVTLIR